MPDQITLWGANGINQGFVAMDTDDARGEKLLEATNAAVAGDTVVAGPGNYRKKVSVLSTPSRKRALSCKWVKTFPQDRSEEHGQKVAGSGTALA